MGMDWGVEVVLNELLVYFWIIDMDLRCTQCISMAIELFEQVLWNVT